MTRMRLLSLFVDEWGYNSNLGASHASLRQTCPRVKNLLLLFAAFGLVLITGCGADSDILSEGDYLFFEAVGIGQSGSVTEVAEWVLRDSVAWVEAQTQLRPLAPFQSVDFTQSVVVVIAIPTDSGGYHIEVESVEEMEDHVLVSYLFHKPALDCITLSALAVPFQVVEVKRFEDKEVRFEHREQKYECTWKQ
ncbi:MAG: hypothetical protein ACI9W4_000573 [Rhodothermales bacterium]|jgi:hypothetical protein